jgi:hypothetical protein
VPIIIDDSGLGFWSVSWLDSVQWQGGALVSYATREDAAPWAGPMVWRSDDLAHWRRVLMPASDAEAADILDLVVGGPGVVALGEPRAGGPSLLWTSPDGEQWTPASNVPDIRFIWGHTGALVGYGPDTWTSPDGGTWTKAGGSPFANRDRTEESAVAVDDGEGAIVFTTTTSDGPTVVYRLTVDGTWRELGSLPGQVRRAVRGPNGIVALGSEDAKPRAWLSTDGASWQSAKGPTGEVQSLVLTPAGYVVTAQRSYYVGCDGFDPAMQVAQTWTSRDGLAWRHMTEDVALDHTELPLVFVEGDRLVSVGLQWSGDFEGSNVPRSAPVAFEAALPVAQPAHTPLPSGAGCS